MIKYSDICRIFVSSLIIIFVGCGNKSPEKPDKKYKMILLQDKYHSIRYDIEDDDYDIKKILNTDEGENSSNNLCILTNDSIYIGLGLNLQDEYSNDLFELYTIQKLEKFSSLIKYEKNDSKDSLLLKIDENNKVLEINENKYYLNDSYINYLKQEGFQNNSIFPFFCFINEYFDDFYSFHTLSKYRWIKENFSPDNKILKAEIKTQHPFNEEMYYMWIIKYIYNDNHLKEIIKYDKDMDSYYHIEYVDKSSDYDIFKYFYNDTESRFYEEGSVCLNNENLNDSTFCSRTNNQRRQIDESLNKIIQHKEYPISKLNLTQSEILNIIKGDLIISNEN